MTRMNLIAALTFMTFPSAAPAAYAMHENPFATAAVSSAVLADIHGTGSAFASDFRSLTNERARSDERTFATVNGVSMDNWWTDTGARMIAANFTR